MYSAIERLAKDYRNLQKLIEKQYDCLIRKEFEEIAGILEQKQIIIDSINLKSETLAVLPPEEKEEIEAIIRAMLLLEDKSRELMEEGKNELAAVMRSEHARSIIENGYYDNSPQTLFFDQKK